MFYVIKYFDLINPYKTIYSIVDELELEDMKLNINLNIIFEDENINECIDFLDNDLLFSHNFENSL